MAGPSFEISAVSHEGLTVTTLGGEPAQLAVVDSLGNVVAAGPAVARAAFDVSVRSYRSFLMGTGHLRVLSRPPDRCA
nr:hypothetical protein [Burkholderia gladioli]